MSTKIIKASAAEPDGFETSISQALVELETNSDLKAQLRELYITKAKEIELHNKKVSNYRIITSKYYVLIVHIYCYNFTLFTAKKFFFFVWKSYKKIEKKKML